MTSSIERIYIGTHLTLITERNGSGPGAYVRGVEFDGVTGMTGNEDRDWPALDPAFGLAKKLGCEGIWLQHQSGAILSGARCRPGRTQSVDSWRRKERGQSMEGEGHA